MRTSSSPASQVPQALKARTRFGGRSLVMSLGIAVAVMFTVGAQAAWGAPEWRQSGGPLEGEYEYFVEIGRTQMRSGRLLIECTTSRDFADLGNPNKTREGVLSFKGCVSESETHRCAVKSPGAGANEIMSRFIAGEVGAAAAGEATSERALELKSEAKNPIITLEGKCLPGGAGVTTVTEAVTGAVYGEMTPKAVEATTLNLKFEITAGKQKVRKFTGHEAQTLSAFGEELRLEASYPLNFFKVGSTLRQAMEVT